jgi:hypothetical protein
MSDPCDCFVRSPDISLKSKVHGLTGHTSNNGTNEWQVRESCSGDGRAFCQKGAVAYQVFVSFMTWIPAVLGACWQTALGFDAGFL